MSNKSEATFHGSQVEGQTDPFAEHAGEAGILTERETVGDWAGHTPTIDAEIAAGQEELAADAELAVFHRTLIDAGIRALVTISGENSRDHGFHDDWPAEREWFPAGTSQSEYTARQVGLTITEKLALIHEEISEALGEIRSGHDPLETYFHHKGLNENFPEQEFDADGKPMLKPEGFLVELADAAIRIADLVYLVGGREQFVKALEVKHEYNQSRPFKHNRKF